MGKVNRSFVVILAALALAVASLAGTSFAESSATHAAKKKPAIATLAVENPNVSVKKKGSDSFVPATNGQKLHQGDTVQTDATGRATINYTDDAYTRLDVSTTLTIETLTEDKGARQIKSSLDTGRTWNRTEALTESGSFEQSGAGATAAVAGTAFMVTCETENLCTFFAGYHTTILRSENGETRFVPEDGECTSDNADLCDEVRILTPDEIAAMSFVQEMYFRDLVEHNFGPGPTLTAFNVVVQNGQVVEVVQVPPTPLALTTSSSQSNSSTSNSAPTLPNPPGISDPPIDIAGGGSNGHPIPTGLTNGITTEDEVGGPAFGGTITDPVVFTVKLTGPAGDTLTVKFTQLPDGSFGAIQWFDPTDSTWKGVVQESSYPDGTQFRFMPEQYEPPPGCTSFEDCYGSGSDYGQAGLDVVNNDDGSVSWSASFTIEAVDQFGQTSAPLDIPITIIDDICDEGSSRDACTLLTTTTGGSTSVGAVHATVTTEPAQSEATAPPSEATAPPTEATAPPTEATTTPTTEESTTSPTASGTDGG